MKVRMNAKLVAKIVVLTAAMIGAFVAASVQTVPAADGGPVLIVCQPGPGCKQLPPTLRS
jgi:endonuclease V-like protein UPF0215 family